MVENMFSNRKNAVDHLKTAVLEDGGHGVQIDAKQSGKNRVVFRCPTHFERDPGKEEGRASSVTTLYVTKKKPGFDCPQLALEGKRAYQRRSYHEAEEHAYQQQYCRFKAILCRVNVKGEADADGNLDCAKCWKFNNVVRDDAKHHIYTRHSSDCTDVGKATGRVLGQYMATAVSADPHMKGKATRLAVAGAASGITAANLPSASTMYRAQSVVKHGELKYYDHSWARLEVFCIELQKTNSTWRVKVVKDEDGAFLRCFIGFGMNLEIVKFAGLDVYAVDSCHVKHLYAKGLQLHILVANTGACRTVIVAISLDITESNESYIFFAEQCKAWGIQAVMAVDRDFVDNKPVLFSDGFKGVGQCIEIFTPKVIHHAACARHLVNSCRESLKRLRYTVLQYNQKRDTGVAPLALPNLALHEEQIFRICRWVVVCLCVCVYHSLHVSDHQSLSSFFFHPRADTTRKLANAMNSLTRSNPHAAKYMKKKKKELWSQLAMQEQNPPSACRSRITSGLVEGTNGTLVDMRKLSPYEMIAELTVYTAEMAMQQQKEAKKWKTEGKVVTPHAGKLFLNERTLSVANKAYKVIPVGPHRYVVVDTMSAGNVKHTVCINTDKPSCAPCDFWNQHHIPCRHMQLVIGSHEPTLMTNRTAVFYGKYWHPSYLVSSIIMAYKDVHVEIPNAPKGLPAPEVICLDSSDEEGWNNTDDMKLFDPMESFGPNKMLPPKGYSSSDYKKKSKSGRPRTKRIASRGSKSGDGALLRKRSKLIRQGGRSSAESGRSVLEDFSLSGF